MTKTSARYRHKPAPTASSRKIMVAVVAGFVLLVVVAIVLLRVARPKNFTLKAGTIVAIDPTKRTGVVEFVHPKSGKTMRVRAQVPPECQILIDGQPAEFRDARVGDQLSADVTYYASRAVANAVRITRATTPATAPADAPPAAAAETPPSPAAAPTPAASPASMPGNPE